MSEAPAAPAPIAAEKPRRRWIDAIRVYREPAVLRMLFLGFSAGLPLALVLGTLSFRLREAGIDRTTIGYLSLVGTVYAFKWVWSPLVDNLPLPLLSRLGKRRSWLLLAQCLIACGLLGMALNDPQVALAPLVGFALLTAFGSATQDIALDAYRIESAPAEQQAALAAAYQTGYRLAMIWASAGVLWMAARAEVANAANYQHAAWQLAYLVMAASTAVGMLTVLRSPEPEHPRVVRERQGLLPWLKASVVDPFAEFFGRYRSRALIILALIGLYRIADVVMGVMANPFYVDLGFTKDEVAAITKVFGLGMTILGGLVGGALALKFGNMKVLWLGAALSAGSNLLYVWLGSRGHDVAALTLVISADNLASGIAGTASIAYLSSLANVKYTATQYAMFSSLVMLIPYWVASFSGKFVDNFGYPTFFTGTAILGIPVLGLVWLASRIAAKPSA